MWVAVEKKRGSADREKMASLKTPLGLREITGSIGFKKLVHQNSNWGGGGELIGGRPPADNYNWEIRIRGHTNANMVGYTGGLKRGKGIQPIG